MFGRRSTGCLLRTASPLSIAVAATLTVGLPSQAHAFCRTTTVSSPADYNPGDGAECWDKGVPLWWRNACVGYSVHDPPSRHVSYNDATNALSTAFTRWTGVSCPTEGNGRSRPSIDVRDLGPVYCGAVELKSQAPNQNVVVFRDDTWTHGPQVLGLTIVQFTKGTGEVFGADMEINTKDMDPIAFRDPVDEGQYDFLSVVTHEAGHFLGIAHSPVEGSTMYWSYNKGQTFQRILSPDDVNAVCTIYRPDGTRSVVVGDATEKAKQAPGCDPTPRGGFTRECADPSPCDVGPAPGSAASHTVGFALAVIVGAFAVRRRRRLEAR